MNNKGVIRVEVADDHPVVREGLTAIINQCRDMQVVAEAANGREAIDQFLCHRPDVVLMDLRMPEIDGVAAIQEIMRTHPDARIAVLTTYGGDQDIFRAFEAGAKGYLLKGSPKEMLMEAIRAAYRGELLIPPEIYVRLTEGRSGPHLSDREMGVLRCMVNGKSNREIAAELRIAEGTVKVHVHRILHKLGAKGRAEAISTTLKKGIVHLPESTSAQ